MCQYSNGKYMSVQFFFIHAFVRIWRFKFKVNSMVLHTWAEQILRSVRSVIKFKKWSGYRKTCSCTVWLGFLRLQRVLRRLQRFWWLVGPSAHVSRSLMDIVCRCMLVLRKTVAAQGIAAKRQGCENNICEKSKLRNHPCEKLVKWRKWRLTKVLIVILHLLLII